MKKYIFGAVFTLGMLLSPMVSQASGLTDSQIQSILSLLNAFGADQSVINNVQLSLTGSGSTATPTPTVGVTNGSLSIGLGAGDPSASNVIAGTSQAMVGQFNFSAQNSSYIVQNLAILVPNNSATSVTAVTVSYKDVNGATQTATQSLVYRNSDLYATATFTGLTMYVPQNSYSNLSVYVGTPTIASAGFNISGTAIKVLLDTGGNTGGNHTFRALDYSGLSATFVGGAPLPSNGVLYVRKSIPTIATIPMSLNSTNGLPSTTGSPYNTTGVPLYTFTITADPAGAIEWTRVKFNFAVAGGAALYGLRLADSATGASVLDTGTSSAVVSANSITVDLTKNSMQPKYQQIAAGATKTYVLYGTLQDWIIGGSLSINLALDISVVANGSATAVSGNTVWSDRSATSHTISTNDWTNGYLLKGGFTEAVTYSNGAQSCVSTYGYACTSTANACGQTNVGTINCSGTCTAASPLNTSCTTSSSPTLSVTSVVGQQVTVAYANLPVHSYINLLWKNENAVYEATGQGQLPNGGSGSIVITQDQNAPSGTYIAEARTTDSMAVVADSTSYVFRSATTALNCTVSASPATVTSGQTTTLTWTSLGANFASWAQNNDANLLGLPASTFVANGSQTFTVSGKSGTISPVLNVSRTDGLSGGCSTTITVNQPTPTATITATPQSGTVPLTVTFSGVAPYGSYSLDFGDITSTAGTACGGGGTCASLNVQQTHTYTKAGTYTALFKSYIAPGYSTYTSIPITITVSPVMTVSSVTPTPATATFATLNPADTGVGATLSTGNLTLTKNVTGWGSVWGGAATNGLSRATIGKSTGKWYWEVTVNVDGEILAGVSQGTLAGLYLGNDINGWGWDLGSPGGNGYVYHAGATAFSTSAAPPGTVLGFALDMNAGTLTAYKNGVLVGVMANGLSGTIYPAIQQYQAGTSDTVNFGATSFQYPVPTGYNALALAATENTNGQSSLASVLSAFGGPEAAPVTQPTFSYVWNHDLQIGSPYFDDVIALQTALTHEGLYSGEITGGFYNQTFAAVKAFQLKYGFDTTGFVGPVTRAKLNAIYVK